MASKPVSLEDLGSITDAEVFDSTSQGLYYEAINQALGALLFSEAEKRLTCDGADCLPLPLDEPKQTPHIDIGQDKDPA